MAHIYHHAQGIHLPDHLLSEGAQSSVFCLATGRITDIIVSIMAEGHIHHSHLSEMGQERQIPTDGITVLYASHDGLDALSLAAQQSIGVACQSQQMGIGPCECLYLIQFLLCQGKSLTVSLSRALALGDVCHHDGSIQAAVCHLGQIHQYTVSARGKHMIDIVLTVGKEHGGITMAVQSDGTLMQLPRPVIERTLMHQPFKECMHGGHLAAMEERFWVPLHSQDGFELRALHCLNNAIRSMGNGPEQIPWMAHGLMMEGVDGQMAALHDAVQQAVLFHTYGMRDGISLHLLTVLQYLRCLVLGVDVLIVTPSQCGCQHLYTSANAQYGYLPVISMSHEPQFLGISLRADAMKSGDRFLTQEQRIEIATAREQ